MDGLHRLRSKVTPVTLIHKLMSDVIEGCHLVYKDEHENIIEAWAFPRDIHFFFLCMIYVAGLSVQKEVCSSQITDGVKPSLPSRWPFGLFHFEVVGTHC